MMQAPQSQARPGTVAPTDTLGAYNLYGNMAERQYQAKLAQQTGLWGGLANTLGTGVTGASKIPAITNAVSNWITPGSAGGSSAPIDLGKAIYNGSGTQTGILGVGPTEAGASAAEAPATWDVSGLASDSPAVWNISDAATPSLWGASTSAAPYATAAPVASSVFDTGTSAVPYAAGTSVASDLAAAAPVAADAGVDAAAGGGLAFADLLPFLFA
jgi:hypothetical protein